MLKKIQHAIATLGFIGYTPYAPGSVGSAAGLIFVVLSKAEGISLLIALVLVIIPGTLAAHSTERLLGKDSGHIVIDEFCGYLVSVLFIPHTYAYLFAAFVLFRIFDIVKPQPIKMVEERISGGAGIMLDDLLAGIYANVCLQLWRYFS